MPSVEIMALAAKRICCTCVAEDYLSRQIEEDGKIAECSYCKDGEFCTWSMQAIADAVEEAFDEHMERTSDNPPDNMRAIYADPECGETWYREGQETAEAIEEYASIPNEAANDVQRILEARHFDLERAKMGEEAEFASDACYDEKRTSADSWHWAWRRFEESLRTEARFFNSDGAAVLARVFGKIDQLRTKPRRPAVVLGGPKHRINHLYRARVFQADAALEEALRRPDVHIGPPPARLSNAGRMNAKGISVFYGASNAAGALAEVRPPVGSRVVVAKFEIIREVRLLDLTALDYARDGGSIFDRSLNRRLERVAFLQTLGSRLTRPVMPDDEAFDYLTTQAIADFLATQNDPRLDGIIFASAQVKSGRNVVLFRASALVEQMDLPPGTEVSVGLESSYDEESGPDYRVWESVPPDEQRPVEEVSVEFGHWLPTIDTEESRAPTLRIDPSSVRVHHIDSVLVRSTAYPVDRFRTTARQTPEPF